MMRRLVLALALLAGCGPSFENEAVELEYLDSLSNPTPEQFLRKRELERAREADLGKADEAERTRRNAPEVRAAAEAADAERREATAEDELAGADASRKKLGLSDLTSIELYKSIINGHPGTRAAGKARRRLDDLGNSPEGKARAAEQARVAREDQAASDLEADYRAAAAKGMTPEAARAVYRSIIKRYPGTRTAAELQERLDNLGAP